MRSISLLTAGVTLALVAGLTIAAAPSDHAVVPGGAGVVRGDLGPAPSGPPLVAARRALVDQATRLGVDPDDFRFTDVVTSPIGLHIHGREVRDGVPVLGSSAAVHLVRGRVVAVEARPSAQRGRAATRPIAAGVARRTALAVVGAGSTASTVTSRWMVAGDTHRGDTEVRETDLRDVWRVSVFDAASAVAATVDVDAATGAIVAMPDTRRLDDYAGNVFNPNPIVTLQDPTLRQPGLDVAGVDTDLDDAALDAARRLMPMLEIDDVLLNAGILRGPWVDVQGPAPMVALERIFDYTRMDPRFEAVMAYAHLDALQRYFQDDLGLTGVNDESQWVIAAPIQGFDNSFYQPGNDVIAFGAGGVDDGEDAEVIVHEYGHAIHDAQVPGWGDHHEGGAMGEGFGDFLAAAWYARVSKGFQDTCVADWDATSYSSDEPPCLRRTDSTKTYPLDMTGSVHADGELWSAYLWRLRQRMVGEAATTTMTADELAAARTDRVLRLVLTSHFLLSPTATFADAVEALQQAAVELGEPDLVPIIEEEAERSGFDFFPLPLG